MKNNAFLVFSSGLILTVIMVAVGMNQAGPGPHGGITKRTGDYIIEMQNLQTQVQAWLLDKNGSPLGNKGISCKARFFFYDGTSIDTELIPDDKDGFASKTGITGISSCRIIFRVKDTEISAIFENQDILVKK